jgi:hypothetical protein
MDPVEWLQSLDKEAVEAIEKRYNAPGLVCGFIEELKNKK